ncbi:F-box and leucine-rich repeat protein 13 isoform X1 [Scyliorhinus torazame]|uniref:F-box and leucine-rich repeat protein 13 isoform X1 n=1 Tax=Scyliorhinus torazame TaxID=75743 RepID=UPI003B5C8C52
MVVFLQFADPVLKHYVKSHSLPQVYEALLIGLFVQCPDDPLLYLEEKIKELQNQMKNQSLLLANKRHLELSWDMFIDDEFKQRMTKMIGSYLSYLFDLESGEVLAPELFEKAYFFRSNRLLRKCFCGWKTYIRNIRRYHMKLQQYISKAENYYKMNKLKVSFDIWMTWVQFQKRQHFLAVKHLQHVSDQLLLKIILKEWSTLAKDSKSTREYFQRLERGELDDESEMHLATVGAMQDIISLIPWPAALKIFSYLGVRELVRCAQVCQFWKVVAQTTSLWSKINFFPVRKQIQDNDIANILRIYRTFVMHLNLRGCNNVSWATFKSISDCRNLQDLNLTQCTSLTDELVSTVVEMCTSLLYLNLAYTTISDGTLRSLSKFGLNLQYLSLAYSKMFTNKGLNYLATGKGCHKLVYLDISGCTQISVRGFKSFGIGCNEIQHLVINDMATLTNSCISAMVTYYYNLTTISFLASPHVSDAAIKALVHGKRIGKIKIEGNQHISDASFKIISKTCPNLNHIYVSDCPRITDSSLKSLSTLKNVVVLNFSDCIRITDSGVRSFLEGPSASKIKELNLSNCILISDLSLLKVVQRCQSLTHLRLRYCGRLTDSGIEWLGNMPTLITIDLTGTNIQEQGFGGFAQNAKLKELILAECSAVNDIGLQKFYTKVTNLEYLELTHCILVSDMSTKTLAFCCRRLTSLNIAGCPKITDLSIQYLAGVCHFIYFLDISGCVNLTDSILLFLKKGCKKLRILKMLYCTNITKEAVKAITNIQYLEYNDENPPVWFGYDNKGNELVTSKEEEEKTEEA